jgi:hypothetical protein
MKEYRQHLTIHRVAWQSIPVYSNVYSIILITVLLYAVSRNTE